MLLFSTKKNIMNRFFYLRWVEIANIITSDSRILLAIFLRSLICLEDFIANASKTKRQYKNTKEEDANELVRKCYFSILISFFKIVNHLLANFAKFS